MKIFKTHFFEKPFIKDDNLEGLSEVHTMHKKSPKICTGCRSSAAHAIGFYIKGKMHIQFSK